MLSNINHLKGYGRIIVAFSVFLIIIGTVVALSIFWPEYEQSFLELGLLGENGKAEQYYSGNDSNININSRMNWHIYIHNYMHTPQEVDIKVKLLNSTMLAPNDSLHLPSPYQPIVEMSAHLDTDEVLILPFAWSILNVSRSGGSAVIDQLAVNNVPVSVNVSSSTSAFRLVFELWVYNQTTTEYDFGWRSGSDYGSASNYMWFNVNFS